MSEKVRDELLVRALHAEEDAKYWRERCRRYEAHIVRIEQAGAEIRGAFERFVIVLDHIKPQGTEPRA